MRRLMVLAALCVAAVLCGCAGTLQSTIPVEIRLAFLGEATRGEIAIKDPVDGNAYAMGNVVLATDADFVSAHLLKVRNLSLARHGTGRRIKYEKKEDKTKHGLHTDYRSVEQPAIALTITRSACKRLREALEGNRRETEFDFPRYARGLRTLKREQFTRRVTPSLVMLVRKRVFAVLAVKGELPRKMLIAGSFDEAEARELVAGLNGATPRSGRPTVDF